MELYVPAALPRADAEELSLRQRPSTQMRPFFAKTGVNSRADGSCYIESEYLKVLCAVYGPRATNKPEFNERATLRCDVKLASFAQDGVRKPPQQTDEEAHLSALCAAALEVARASLLVDKYPKSAIDVSVLVLEADGPVLAAAISAASLALADAGIEMRDVVAACSVATLPAADGGVTLLLDPNGAELALTRRVKGALLTVALLPTVDVIAQSALLCGTLPLHHWRTASALALDGCRKLAVLQRDALVTRASEERSK